MNNKKIAVFPGSFDPITKGHESIVLRALPLFDQIIIAVGVNSSKSSFFTVENRLSHVSAVFSSYEKITVESYSGLTIDFCKNRNASFILRGLRDVKDFDYEKSIALTNTQLDSEIETVFFMTDINYSAINSSIVREILKNGGAVDQFIPKAVIDLI